MRLLGGEGRGCWWGQLERWVDIGRVIQRLGGEFVRGR